MLKHYEGEHCKFTKKAHVPHCFHAASGVASFFSICMEPSSVAAKLLLYERSRPFWGGINKDFMTWFFH